MELKDKRVLVFGTGISGIGAAQLLLKMQAVPVMYDGNTKLTAEDVKAKLPKEYDAQIVIGELPDELLDTIDLAVLSPGVPTDIEPVNRIRKGLRMPVRFM